MSQEPAGNPLKINIVKELGDVIRNGQVVIAQQWNLYRQGFGLHPKDDRVPGYLYTEDLDGVKHFALWPLSMVAQACFDNDSWPGDVPVPQAWIDF